MTVNTKAGSTLACSITAWLSVADAARAITFYKSAFGAVEVYHLEDPGGGVVSRLSVHGAEFWLSSESAGQTNPPRRSGDGGPVRMILTVPDPDTMFAQAVAAGAFQVFPVGEGHGWRLGRLVDPFDHHWEIGRPLT